MLTLDFTVLILGVHARRSYRDSTGWAKAGEVALAVLVAAAISYVSIQMQSIVARSNAESITIDTAAAQLGISMIALTWERSTLVLFLIFMSGFLRDEGKHAAPAGALAEQVQTSAITTLAPPQALLAERSSAENLPPIFQGQFASREQEIIRALQHSPNLSDAELAEICGCHLKTAAKWATRYREGLTS